MISQVRMNLAIKAIKTGVIACPVDTVYGLSCLPDNTAAINKIITLKRRSKNKGLILLASKLSYFAKYVDDVSILPRLAGAYHQVDTPTTYLVNKNTETTKLLSGNFDTIALRLTTNPLITSICGATQSAVVSTSANISGGESITSLLQLKLFFADELDFIIAPSGYNDSPSRIIDLLTGKVYR